MGLDTLIAWCHATFNPWWGCWKISEGCANCYAWMFDRRVGGAHWGTEAPRRFFGDKHWAEPLKWNARAEREGTRYRVFCASMADWLEDRCDLDEHRLKLLNLIERTPHLDWLMLTKRPNNFNLLLRRALARVPGGCSLFDDAIALGSDWLSGKPPENVWFGVTTENQARADERVPVLLSIPARVRFLSCEPLLGPLDILPYVTRYAGDPDDGERYLPLADPGLSWVICGGESGPKSRPFNLTWARSLRDQCREAGAAFFMKQLGSVPVMGEAEWRGMDPKPLLRAAHHDKAPAGTVPLALNHPKGEDPTEWPGDLQIQEFPR